MVALAETREAGSSWYHVDFATTVTITDAVQLIRVVVNTPAVGATVTVTDLDPVTGGVVAVVDASKRDAGVSYFARVGGLEVTLDDDALDVTILYD